MGLGIGAGLPAVEIRAGHCYAIGTRRQAVHRGEARRPLADGVRTCSHRTPTPLWRSRYPATPPLPPQRADGPSTPEGLPR
ncbi:DUF6233 domain-containing protein [Streptomyces sp. V3I8]|uniref:DUF6233 domain-containing protein n=1 Tax=Streptomyces sp. V3I8 TaxID=3042279 RepID=UPI0027D7F608|nr:DUF6233 domain-containing protein [Streptomyces sp. V3I8]